MIRKWRVPAITAAKGRRAAATCSLTLVLASLALAGCNRGPKLVEARGTVTYNNAPVPDAQVVFVSNDGGMPSIARTDEQGRFTVTTEGKAGAPVGSYEVAITAVRLKRPVSEAEAVGMTSEEIAANHETLIPVKYNNLITSELTATVTDDPAANEFNFDLK